MIARGALCALVLLVASAAAAEELFDGYRWERIGDGIFLHRPADPLAGPVDGNSVVILTDRDVFVVDTHINPAATRAVINKVRNLTRLPVSHVINTHWHDDHTNGNQAWRSAFPGVRIVAHAATLASLREEWPPMLAQRRES